MNQVSWLQRFVCRIVPQLRSPLWRSLMLANLALHLGYLLPLCLRRHFQMADVDVYALAAEHVVAGRQLYPLFPTGDAPTPDGGFLPFLYPPSFAAALAPLGYLPHQTTVRLLYLVTFVAFWAYALCLARLATGRWALWPTLGAGLILTIFPGSYFSLVSGQVEPLLWLIFALALLTPARGALLAASCLVKPFAVWPLALAAWREPRRVVWQATVVVVAGLVLGGFVAGWGSYAQWLSYTPHRMYRVVFFHDNISLSLLPLRLLGWQSLPDWGRAFLMAMYLLGPAAVAWLTRRRPLAVQYAWVGAAAILFAPFSRDYYLPLLLAPLALELGLWLRRPPTTTKDERPVK